MTSVTNTEKIEFLNNIVVELHKNTYAACIALGIDAATLNIETHNLEELLSLFSEQAPFGFRVHPKDHMACVIITRNIANLIAVNKKLDELNNV